MDESGVYDNHNFASENNFLLSEESLSNGKVVMVTSFKGGVGKTTVSANLSLALALRGNKVVAVDCDIESRCLDIILGLEDASLYSICDVLDGRCSLDEALVEDERCSNLSFIPAPAFYDFLDSDVDIGNDRVKVEAVAELVKELRKRFDYVILDCPARPDALYKALVSVSTHAIVVSLHTAASIRAAEKTAMMLSDMSSVESSGFAFGDLDGALTHNPAIKTRLIVNCFKANDVVNGVRPKIYDVISKASTKLLGVVPNDDAVSRPQETGSLAFEVKNGKNPFWRSIENIAARCDGEHVLLLKNVKTGKPRSKLI